MNLFRDDIFGANCFTLSIGVVQLSFSKISNISKTIEYDTIQEGGRNGYVHSFTKPQTQQEILTCERGITTWGNAVLAPLGLKPGGKIKMPVIIMVMKYPGHIDKAYCFDEGVVTKWETSDLNAMGDEVLVERFEIAHTGLKEFLIG